MCGWHLCVQLRLDKGRGSTVVHNNPNHDYCNDDDNDQNRPFRFGGVFPEVSFTHRTHKKIPNSGICCLYLAPFCEIVGILSERGLIVEELGNQGTMS